MEHAAAAAAENDDNIIDDASASTSSASALASSGLSLSASDSGGDSSLSSSASGEQPPSVPLVLRLFEHLVRHSIHSDTWRYMLRAASEDMIDYLTGISGAARTCLEDPFYPGLDHDIRLSRSQAGGVTQECLSWRLSVTSRCIVSLAIDSSESAVALTRCHQPERHQMQSGCCHVHCWPIGSLGDFAGYLDAAYRRSLLVSAEHADLMRGKYHGCRRG